MSFPVGSLVRARDREWVVLPESDGDFLVLQPVSGSDREVAGVLTTLEPVEPASFPPPTFDSCGGVEDWRLLRDAVRFGFRSSVGPFRSLARIAVAPRAYQLVPLMMALKMDPVRLLIADDVGIGKTVEALLIARELMEQGDVKRMAVLCSPALAEQWQREMQDKFHIDAELVLPSTASKLERRCRFGQSLFDRFPFVVVSTDFIKADSRRNEFIDQAPELIIVDEAHTASGTGGGRGGTQRFELVSKLSEDPKRHLLLLTATPHSGKQQAFQNLLSILDADFAELPDDLAGEANLPHRRRLAQHFVQRRRADIEEYVGEDTPFPRREWSEATYSLSAEYGTALNKIVRLVRDAVPGDPGSRTKGIRLWSMLGLLRAAASSPRAAASTLKNRSATMAASTSDEVDRIGREAVLDLSDDDTLEGLDVIPGSDVSELEEDAVKARRRYRDLAREIEGLEGPDHDNKLKDAIALIKGLIADGHDPIVFCRFIATAEYVAEHLRDALPKKVTVDVVTGTLPPEEREDRVAELGRADSPRILVATDCLSEGVNLQDHFDAVVHYDLSWNPTRHEQREGRVDRYGQPSPVVRTVTYWGKNNGIDEYVLDVLIRKHRLIREALGISVPVPGDADEFIEAVLKDVIDREDFGLEQLTLAGFEEEERERLHLEWEDAAEREKRSRTLFAQHAIKTEEVEREVRRVRAGLGTEEELAAFIERSVPLVGGAASVDDGAIAIDLEQADRELRYAAPRSLQQFTARTSLPVQDGEFLLTRTHPFVEALASAVLDAALKPSEERAVARCGSTSSPAVDRDTAVFLIRHRVLLTTTESGEERPALVESCEFIGTDGIGVDADWLDPEDVESLLGDGRLATLDSGNGAALQQVFDDLDAIGSRLDERAEAVAAEVLNDHLRVREASKRTGVRYKAEPTSRPDVLGVYALAPAGAS